MNDKMTFGKALTYVISYPVYAVFAVILIVYLCLGNIAESLLILVTVFLSALVRTAFVMKNPGCEVKKQGSAADKESLFYSYRSFSLKLSVAFALSAVPLMIFRLIVPSSEGFSESLSQILSAVSLGLSVFCGAPGSVIEYVCAISHGDSSKSGYSFKDITSSEKIAGCDKAVIMNPALLYDSTREVRAVWLGGALYKGMSLSECSNTTPGELCILSCAFSQNPENAEGGMSRNDMALYAFGERSTKKGGELPFEGCSFDGMYSYPREGDVSVFATYSNGYVSTFIRSKSQSVLDGCGYLRMQDDTARELNTYELDNLYKASEQLVSEGLTLFYFISYRGRGVPARNSRSGVVEAVIGVGGTFPAYNRDASGALSDFGISSLIVMPGEGRAAADFSSGCGLAEPEDRIIRYSDFTDDMLRNDSRLETVRALLGFPRENLNGILRGCAEKSAGILAVVHNSDDLQTMSYSRASACVSDRSDDETRTVSDVTVSKAEGYGNHTGMAALFSMFTESVVSMCRLSVLLKILFSYGFTLVFSFIIPFFCGASSLVPSAFTITFCSLVVTFAAAVCTLTDRVLLRSRACYDTDRAGRKRYFLESLSLGLLTAVAVCVTGLVAFRNSPASASNYMSGGLICSGISMCSALRICERRKYGVTGINLYSVATALCGLALCFANSYAAFPDCFGKSLSTAGTPFVSFLISLIPAVVPFVFMGISVALDSISAREKPERL